MDPRENQRNQAANKKHHPNWGGRRPGAGAPKGNMNALKHGRRSERMARLGMMLAVNPKTRAELLAIADKWDRRQMKATEVAEEIFTQILERGIQIGQAQTRKSSRATARDVYRDPSRLIVLPPTPDRRSIETEATGPNVAGNTPTLDETQEKNSPTPSIKTDEQHSPIDQDPYGKSDLINR